MRVLPPRAQAGSDASLTPARDICPEIQRVVRKEKMGMRLMAYALCAGCRGRLTTADVLVCARCWSYAVSSCLSKARYESAGRARGRMVSSKAARRLAAAAPQKVLAEVECGLCQGVHHVTMRRSPSKGRHLGRSLAALQPVYLQLRERYQKDFAAQALEDLARRRRDATRKAGEGTK